MCWWRKYWHVFHVRWFILDKRSRTNSIRSSCCLWLWESQPMLCFTINVFYLFWSNAHLSPPPRPLQGHLENPAGTHTVMAARLQRSHHPASGATDLSSNMLSLQSFRWKQEAFLPGCSRFSVFTTNILIFSYSRVLKKKRKVNSQVVSHWKKWTD